MRRLARAIVVGATLSVCLGSPIVSPRGYAESGTHWLLRAAMPTARVQLAATTGRDGRIYALGGIDYRSALATAEVYDPERDVWSSLPHLPRAVTGPAAATGPDGHVYVLGGLPGPCDGETQGPAPTAKVFAYDPVVNVWTHEPRMPTARWAFVSVTGRDSRIYAIGGADSCRDNAATNAFEVYNVRRRAWKRLHPTPFKRMFPAVTLGSDGRIYVFGGIDARGSWTSSAYVYDPKTKVWSKLAPLPDLRQMFAAIGRGNDIYVVGAGSYNGIPDPVPALVYNIRSNMWSAAAPTGYRNGLVAARDLRGWIYAIGGGTPAPSGSAPPHPSDVVEAYPP